MKFFLQLVNHLDQIGDEWSDAEYWLLPQHDGLEVIDLPSSAIRGENCWKLEIL